MSVETICRCDLCGNQIKKKDKFAELIMPQIRGEKSREVAVPMGIVRFFEQGGEREKLWRFHVCAGCFFGLVGQKLGPNARRRLLEVISNRAPESVVSEED